MAYSVKGQIKFSTNLGLNGEGIQNLIHDSEYRGIAGE